MSDPSSGPLRVLHVEDSPADAELVLLRLADEGFRVDGQRVADESGYRAALAAQPDCILADWSLPHFSGPRALQVLRERDLNLPFIVVSAQAGEETIVDALRHGAYDFVSKNRLERLGTAVRHALAERRMREERRAAEAALRESAEQLRALASHLVAVREEDHTRMAREIHDEIGQGLSALRLDLTWLARKLPTDSDALRRRADASIGLIDEMIAAGQRIVSDLRPPILDDLGLVPAMEWYVQRFAEHSGIPTTFDVGSAPPPELLGPLAVVAYRIVQEALTNVARHAQATHATVRLAVAGGQLVLEVKDDGRGIPGKGLDDPHSFGLAGMRERAASQGGTVRITGGPRRGTTVRVTLPLQPPALAAR